MTSKQILGIALLAVPLAIVFFMMASIIGFWPTAGIVGFAVLAALSILKGIDLVVGR